jgi:hypothetical protein
MEPDKQALEAWETGVALGDAWWDFADNENKKLFRERKDKGRGFHLEIQYTLEIDLIARLEDGKLQAYGIEKGSDVGPIPIARYYFSKTAKLDYINDTVTALGKKFYEVRVQGKREPTDETRPSEREVSVPPGVMIDPVEISIQRKRERERERLEPPSVARTFNEPHEITGQGEREPPHGASSSAVPAGEPSGTADQEEQEPRQKTLSTGPASLNGPKMGRPPSLPKLREVVRELINGSEFDTLSKKEIVNLIRRKAHLRFPSSFPKSTQPSINKINEALKAECWPPPVSTDDQKVH